MSEPKLLSEMAAAFAVERQYGRYVQRAFRRPLFWLERFLERPPTTADLTEETVAEWAAWMCVVLSRSSAAVYHARVLRLWRFLSSHGEAGR